MMVTQPELYSLPLPINMVYGLLKNPPLGAFSAADARTQTHGLKGSSQHYPLTHSGIK